MSNLFTTTTSATGMPTVERDGIPNNVAHNIPGSPRSGSPTCLPQSKLRQVRIFIQLSKQMLCFKNGTHKILSTQGMMGNFTIKG